MYGDDNEISKIFGKILSIAQTHVIDRNKYNRSSFDCYKYFLCPNQSMGIQFIL